MRGHLGSRMRGPLLYRLKVSTEKPLRKRDKYPEVEVELPGGVGTKVGVEVIDK